MLDFHSLADDEYLVRLGWADRVRLTRLLLTACGWPLAAAVLAAVLAWGVLIASLWHLAGTSLKALTGYPAAVAAVGSAGALAGRLAFFALEATVVSSIILLSLNALIAHCLEGDAPRTLEGAIEYLLGPWSGWRALWGPLAAWALIGAAWGAALGLISLLPWLGLLPVAVGVSLFALLHNGALWHLTQLEHHPHLEHEEPGLWTAVARPFQLLRHSEILWRKTLAAGLASVLPGLLMTGAALSPVVKIGPGWSLLLFGLGLAVLVAGLTFFSCFFALNYRQALANYRLRRAGPVSASAPEDVSASAPEELGSGDGDRQRLSAP